MKLDIEANVRARRTTLKDIAEVQNAIKDALHGTTLFLESALSTLFTRDADNVDTFLVDFESVAPQGPHSFLRLRNGFVDIGQALTVKLASSLANLATATAKVVDTDYKVQATEGLIILHNCATGDITLPLSNPSIQCLFYAEVTYTSGFNVDGDDPLLFLPAEVPPWLKEAAVVQTIITINTQSPQKRSAGSAKMVADLQKYLEVIIDPYRRLFGYATPVMFNG